MRIQSLSRAEFLEIFQKRNDKKKLLVANNYNHALRLRKIISPDNLELDVRCLDDILDEYIKINLLKIPSIDLSLVFIYKIFELSKMKDKSKREVSKKCKDIYNALKSRLKALEPGQEIDYISTKEYRLYKAILNEFGFKTDYEVFEDFINSKFSKNLFNNYDAIFFTSRLYFYEKRIINKLDSDVYVLKKESDLIDYSKFVFYQAQEMDSLIAKIATDIKTKYSNKKIAILTKDKSYKTSLVDNLYNYGIYPAARKYTRITEIPTVKDFIINSSLLDYEAVLVEPEHYEFLSLMGEDTRIKFLKKLEESMLEISNYNLNEEEKGFFIDLSLNSIREYEQLDSNIEIEDPDNIFWDCDVIYLFGLSKTNFLNEGLSNIHGENEESLYYKCLLSELSKMAKEVVLCDFKEDKVLPIFIEAKNRIDNKIQIENNYIFKHRYALNDRFKNLFTEKNIDAAIAFSEDFNSFVENKIKLDINNLTLYELKNFENCPFTFFMGKILKDELAEDNFALNSNIFEKSLIVKYARESHGIWNPSIFDSIFKDFIEEFERKSSLFNDAYKNYSYNMLLNFLKEFFVQPKKLIINKKIIIRDYEEDRGLSIHLSIPMFENENEKDIYHFLESASSITSGKALRNLTNIKYTLFILSMNRPGTIIIHGYKSGKISKLDITDDEELNDLKKTAFEKINLILSNLLDSDFKPNYDADCSYCKYSQICKRDWRINATVR